MNPPRILIARLSAHGDVVTTLPVIAALKARCPDAMIGWLVDESAADLLKGIAAIDALHIFPGKAIKQTLKTPKTWWSLFKILKALTQELAQNNYDACLDVQGLFKSAFLPAMAHIPRRFGFARTRECADIFYTDKLPAINLRDGGRHVVDCYVDAAHQTMSALGMAALPNKAFPTFPLPEQPCWLENNLKSELEALRCHESLTGKALVMIAPATRWASKQWPPEHWQTLLKGLLAKGHPVAILGGPADRALCQAIEKDVLVETPSSKRTAQASPGLLLDWTGKTRWSDLWQILPHGDVFIGPDSAPLHMAAAVAHATGRPQIIGLYGPTAAGRTGPYPSQTHPHVVLNTSLECQPCFKKQCRWPSNHAAFMQCLQALCPQWVLASLDNLQRDGGLGGIENPLLSA
ncbi:MAG: glycosyltransferase family 9 protein [Vampirovibrionales bacterium]|nr:glycosyltransferase family 9 protein [Vampirovibrionales bacterium]